MQSNLLAFTPRTGECVRNPFSFFTSDLNRSVRRVSGLARDRTTSQRSVPRIRLVFLRGSHPWTDDPPHRNRRRGTLRGRSPLRCARVDPFHTTLHFKRSRRALERTPALLRRTSHNRVRSASPGTRLFFHDPSHCGRGSSKHRRCFGANVPPLKWPPNAPLGLGSLYDRFDHFRDVPSPSPRLDCNRMARHLVQPPLQTPYLRTHSHTLSPPRTTGNLLQLHRGIFRK